MTQHFRTQLQAALRDAYILEHELGGGGMRCVVAAENTALRRRMAVEEDDFATARTARARGHLLVLSDTSTTSVEEVNRARGEPAWYSLCLAIQGVHSRPSDELPTLEEDERCGVVGVAAVLEGGVTPLPRRVAGRKQRPALVGGPAVGVVPSRCTRRDGCDEQQDAIRQSQGCGVL